MKRIRDATGKFFLQTARSPTGEEEVGFVKVIAEKSYGEVPAST
jgi:hypothetical protein